MYRILEKHITPSYSEFSIQRRFMFRWWDITVDDQYLSTFATAQQWIKLKRKGYPVTKYYYE